MSSQSQTQPPEPQPHLMAHPSRNSSLGQNNSSIYQFAGYPQSQRLGVFNTASAPPPRIYFDHVSNDSDEDIDEKTGFSTPDSDTEKQLSYSYHASSNRTHKMQQKPLINYIKNDWQSKGSTMGTGEADDDFCPEGWVEVLCSRAFKRWLLVCLILIVGSLIWWFRYFEPKQAKSMASSFLLDSLKGRFEDDSEWGYFGSNRRVEFAGMQHLSTLPRNLVPGSEVPGAQNRRLIIVGDVHGCADELEILLKKISFNPSQDHLISTGDMVSKGPSSSQVIDIMMSHNASCVRGNNEDRVLHAYRDHHAPSHQKILATTDPETDQSAVSLKRGHREDLALAASLSAAQISYIASCPVILDLGKIPSMGSTVSVVHAGLIPGVPLEKQDPSAVMTMRSIDLRNQVPSPNHPPDPAKGPPPRPRSRLRKPDYSQWDEHGRLAVLPWGDVWEAFQDIVPNLIEEGIKREKAPPPPAPTDAPSSNNQKTPTEPPKPINPYKNLGQTSVIYGHDSHPGIVKGNWHYGLDGGCFRGGNLAALVLEETSFMSGLAGNKIKRTIVTVPCKDYRDEETKAKQGALSSSSSSDASSPQQRDEEPKLTTTTASGIILATADDD